MRPMRRKLIQIGMWALLVGILTQSSLTFASTTTIFERRTPVEAYGDGVTYENIQRLTSGGWININVMRVQLDKNVELSVLTDDYLSKRTTLSQLVAKNNEDNNIVGAINTDFFDVASNSTMGNIMYKGNLLTTSVGLEEFASFSITRSGIPFVTYLNAPVNTFTNGRHEMNITYFNKPYLNYSRTIYYDRTWAPQSYGNTLDLDVLEMLVVDDVVLEMRRRGAPFDIPENGYVLAAVGSNIGQMRDNFKVGDTIEIKYDVNIRFMDLIMGGGAQLVDRGKVVPTFSLPSNGNAPRTAIGITRDRKEVFFVTIDGRSSSYRGVSLTELARIMIELGAFEAINMDGGGSTQMVGKSPWQQNIRTINTPSDNAERRMYTGLAIRNVIKENPVLRDVRIQLRQNKWFVGTPITLRLDGNDTNFQNTALNQEDVKWTVDGLEGTLEQGVFTPSKPGQGVLKAEYKGFVAEQAIEVTSDAVRLVVSTNQLRLDLGGTRQLFFSVLTSQGESISIPSHMVKNTVDSKLGTFDSQRGIFTASKAISQGYMTFEFDGLKTHVAIMTGLDSVVIHDFEKPTANFRSFPIDVPGHYFEHPQEGYQGAGGYLAYDFSQTEVTRAAYMDFIDPKNLPINTTGIGMWVKGDEGNGHWLRGHVIDANGKVETLTFARNVNWKGWRYVSAELPSGLVAPIKLQRVYLVEIDPLAKNKGHIIVDQIDARLSQEMTMNLPDNVTRERAASSYKLPDGLPSNHRNVFNVAYAQEWTKAIKEMQEKRAQNWVHASKGFEAQMRNGAMVVTMNSHNNSIRENGIQQWTDLLKFVEKQQSAPIVVVMNNVFYFKDPMELDLFYEKWGEVVSKGTPVTVIHATSNTSPNIRFRNGVQILSVPYANKDHLHHVALTVKNGQVFFEFR